PMADRATTTDWEAPGKTFKSKALKSPHTELVVPKENFWPAVNVERLTCRTAASPSRPTYRICPSSEIASFAGSLPTGRETPIFPVTGSITVTVFGLLVDLLGIDA